MLLTEQAETDLAELIQGTAKAPNRPPGSNAQLIGDLYASFMDEAALNSLGASPVKPHLAEVDALKTTAELADLLGKFSMIGIGGPVNGFVEADAGDPTRVAVYLGQAGTALPDRDYYLSTDQRGSWTSARSISSTSRRCSGSWAGPMPRPTQSSSSRSKPISRASSGRASRAATR